MQQIPIDPDETAGELEARMAKLGAQLVLHVVGQMANGTSMPVTQDKTQATKAPRLTKQMGQIDWTKSAQVIKNQVRALQPWPRAFTTWKRSDGEPLRLIVHRVTVFNADDSIAAGTVIQCDSDLVVATDAGSLRLDEVQPAGKRAMSAADFLRGNSVQVGDLLE